MSPVQLIPKTKEEKDLFFKIIIIVLVALALIALTASSLFFYFRYKQERSKNPNVEIAQLTTTISKFMDLPDETPTLATVTNKDDLQKNALFDKAENGDKVLIFTKAQKAILYRPSQKKVIEILPINTTETTTETETQTKPATEPTQNTDDTPTSESESQSITVVLYNGSDKVGMTTKAEKELTENYENLEVIAKETAQGSYEQNVIVDLTGQNPDWVQKLTQKFSAQVLDLPEGEEKPTADLLIILGNDYTK